MPISANALADATADFVDGRIAKAFGTSLNSTTPAASAEIPTGAITPTILARALTRCVDSRIAAITGNSADAGDFDIRQYDSTGILIYSTDAAGNLHEKPVHYVNPNSTNAQLVTLGKSLIALTNDTYQATYRVTKTLCDTPDYSQYLVVDSPFTQGLSDNCGVVWTPNGTVTISDGAVQFNNTYLLSTEPVEFGGAEFAISFHAFMSSNSSNCGGLFCVQPTTNTGNSNAAGRINFFRRGYSNNLAVQLINADNKTISNDVIVASNFLNALHHFELDYIHDASTLKLFVDGQLSYTQSVAIERFARYVYIGCTGYDPNEQRMVGSISNFKIYDGVALHTEDFTPE